ncbi:TatD family hydrolase [Tenuifilaceae bacterium CYCD]|nr:TatD family hydrolase [Tenuifilaceae bacterium CYCD]
MNFINFHCHKPNLCNKGIGLYSLNVDDIVNEQVPENCTIGIHPWQCEHPDIDEWIRQMDYLVQSPNVLAIGEIGLDRLKGGNLDLQTQILVAQVEIAQKVNKPIIIHCVRAWSELIKSLSNPKYKTVKKAIHGFRGKADMAKQLVMQDYYLSFGSILVDPTPELAESLTMVPLNRLFFETDTSEMPIGEVYSAASDILDIPIEELLQETEKNFTEFFNR